MSNPNPPPSSLPAADVCNPRRRAPQGAGIRALIPTAADLAADLALHDSSVGTRTDREHVRRELHELHSEFARILCRAETRLDAALRESFPAEAARLEAAGAHSPPPLPFWAATAGVLMKSAETAALFDFLIEVARG